MAHFRKMNVGDQQYLFNIGDTYIQIRDPDGKNNFYSRIEHGFGRDCVVTPKMIRDLIVNGYVFNNGSRYFKTCSCEDVEKHVEFLPYDAEIFNKKIYAYMCERCFDENAADI